MNKRTLYVLFFSMFVMFFIAVFLYFRIKNTVVTPDIKPITPEAVVTPIKIPESEKSLLLEKYPFGLDTTLYRFVSFDGNKSLTVVANGVTATLKLSDNFPLFCNSATFKNANGVESDASNIMLDYSKMPSDTKYTFIKSALDLPLSEKIIALSNYSEGSPIRLNSDNGVVTKITIYVKDPKNCK